MTLYSISVMNPSTDPESWPELRQLLHATDFQTIIPNKSLQVITKASCVICHGASHTAPFCPFPSIPSWYGPRYYHPKPPATTLNLTNLKLIEANKRRLQAELHNRLDIESIYG